MQATKDNANGSRKYLKVLKCANKENEIIGALSQCSPAYHPEGGRKTFVSVKSSCTM